MTSVVRALSQIPASGTYVTTATLVNNVYDIADNGTITAKSTGVPTTAGTILYDMGKTVFIKNGALTTRVLRKVQVAPFESDVAFNAFYIQIGGSTGTTSAVARL